MKHTLIVWDSSDTEVQFYIVPGSALTPQFETFLEKAHGYYINAVLEDTADADGIEQALDFLNAALCEVPEHCPEAPEAWRCIWHQYRVAMVGPIKQRIDAVYYAGFLP